MTKHMYARLLKVDEAKREVVGTLVAEVPDRDGEVFDYASSVPFFRAWNDNFEKATGGQSVGNLREQHRPDSVAGKFTAMNYDDAAKAITVTARVVDDAAWRKVAEGVYTGFSIGGSYQKRWTADGVRRYTAEPVEGSLVDYPCVPVATFEIVKSDGSVELRKLKGADVENEAKTKRVDGEDLESSAFAYVGDPEKTDTWKLPIKFGSEEATASHIRNALARFDQTDGIPAGEKAAVRARLVAAAKKHGIEVSTEKAQAVADLKKELLAVVEKLAALGGEPAHGGATPMDANEGVLKRARTLTQHVDAARDAHRKMGEHLDRLSAAIGADPDEDEDDGEAKKAAGGSISKGALARFAAIEDAQKSQNELLVEMAKTIAVIAGQPAPPAAAANANGVAKGATADEKSETDPQKAMKAALARGATTKAAL